MTVIFQIVIIINWQQSIWPVWLHHSDNNNQLCCLFQTCLKMNFVGLTYFCIVGLHDQFYSPVGHQYRLMCCMSLCCQDAVLVVVLILIGLSCVLTVRSVLVISTVLRCLNCPCMISSLTSHQTSGTSSTGPQVTYMLHTNVYSTCPITAGTV